jgi:selenide,water dikinase
VLGLVHPDRIFTKAGAQAGDAIYLTKPLGTGIITTAAMRDLAAPEHLASAVESMTRLNRHASHIVRDVGANCLTDVTGFALLGHGYEVAAAGGVRLRIDSSLAPLLPGALDYAGQEIVTGGAERNRKYLAGKVYVADDISEALGHVLFDPQTSGGLLFTVEPAQTAEVESRFQAAGLGVWRIGEVLVGEGVEVV